jgi:bifunctional NMN adenylyltransferase/nudix hydrolase
VPAFDLALLLAAFEPFHHAHRAALEHAFTQAGCVLVLVGSAGAARTLRHPWTAEERVEMVLAGARDLDRSALRVAAVPDHLYDDARWARVVEEAAAAALPQARRIAQLAWVPGAEDRPLLPSWTLLAVRAPAAPGFWEVRRGVFGDASDARAQFDAALPASTRGFLDGYRTAPHFEALADEMRYIERFQASWNSAPYPPIFVTTDAVVVHDAHLLLVRRGQPPGKGLWALPGGFVDQDETLFQACLRELQEETGMALPASGMRQALRGHHAFDAPHRSLRGRTITHVFRFDLDAERPSVQGGDDAAEAQWVPLHCFAGMQAQMFEDHYHIAMRMLE